MNGLKMHEALIKYSVNGLSIVRILEFTKSKKLKPSTQSKCGTLADNVYNVDELERCINLIKRPTKDQQLLANL